MVTAEMTNLNERCGSCGGQLKLDKDGYPIRHSNRGDGECVHSQTRMRRHGTYA